MFSCDIKGLFGAAKRFHATFKRFSRSQSLFMRPVEIWREQNTPSPFGDSPKTGAEFRD